MDDAQLHTVFQQRRFDTPLTSIGQPVAMFMKHTLEKRVRQLSKLAEAWDAVIPEDIREHTALETFSRGTLTVMVDSAPHRFKLQMLLNGGLKAQLQENFPGAINKVRLVPGQFYAVDVAGQPRYEF
ncbi:MAG: DUF721 domain-containing protein [Phycisphaerae bacterium]